MTSPALASSLSVRRPTMIDEEMLPSLAAGCALLSTGGGGAARVEIETTQAALRRHGPVQLVDLVDLDPAGLVLPLSVVGAPAVGAEDLVDGREPGLIRGRVEAELGRPVVAVMCTEIGGGNGVAPIGWAAGLGLPVLDADGMGRAFPELPMISMNVAGRSPTPAVVADSFGNVAVLRCSDPVWAERWARALCVASGSSVVIADYLMTVAEAHGAVIEGSVSVALTLGRALRTTPGVDAIATFLGARTLISGTVTGLDRHERGGFTRGVVTVSTSSGDRATIDLYNEYVAVHHQDHVVASAPDLIAVLDNRTRQPTATEHVELGQLVTVLTWACHPLWSSPAGLRVAGPRAFGYDLDHPPRPAVGLS